MLEVVKPGAEFAADGVPDVIRIPSASGAAIILTPVSWVSNDNGVASLVRLWDVALVEPTRSVCYRRRQFTDADFVALLAVLRRAMIDDFPHAPTEPDFSATKAGMQLSVPSSTGQDVDLQIDMVIFLDEPIADYDQMRFTTARAALWEPVEALRALTGIDVDDSTAFDLGE